MTTRMPKDQITPHVDSLVTCVAAAKRYLHSHRAGDRAEQVALAPMPLGKTPNQAARSNLATSPRLQALHDALTTATQRPLTDAEFLEEYAQAMACGQLATGTTGPPAALVARVASPFIAASLHDATAAWRPPREIPNAAETVLDAAQLARLYEPFLGQHHQHRRSRNGVYYTPVQLANFIVEHVDGKLRDEFGLADGLADRATWAEVMARQRTVQCPAGATPDAPFVRILDPAVGGGVFLVAAIELIHRTMQTKWQQSGWSSSQVAAAWQDYVAAHLLPRLCGLDVMLPAAVVAHWQVFQALARTGYQFQGDERIRVYLFDTLGDWSDSLGGSTAEFAELDVALHACRHEPFTVILGNPPFSGISRNQGRWITNLLRGRAENGQPTASYYQSNGKPLAEKKHWLQDDYVKFLRYAQWRIETTGAGIVGFVTNHGYLDNITFRGLREQLLTTFPRITVLDLHGNAKKKERGPDGQRDENVFGIESGIAVGLLRLPILPQTPNVAFGELWGTRDHKLACLAAGARRWEDVAPAAPYHFFTPCRNETADEYAQGISLTELMPVNSTVAVTARDRFVISFQRDELVRRMELFRDLAIPDDQIRARFFSNSRSTRYPPGDTRGWKLAAARKRMAEDPDWKRHIRTCLYRPFDRRWIYWADWMVDWPRMEVNQHLTELNNLALIARRQMLPTQPCNFFWVTRTIPIDGVIRSDNRGSESAFPLRLVPDPAVAGGGATLNLNEHFVAILAETLQLPWCPELLAADDAAFGPLDVFNFIYAQLYSSTYRCRYDDWLRIDFPRVFVPGSKSLFRRLTQLGAALVAAHADPANGAANSLETPGMMADPGVARPVTGKVIKAGDPLFAVDRIQLGDRLAVEDVTPEIWEFHVGGHQVCRKWWRDRKGRVPTADDVEAYRRLVRGVRQTIAIVSQIDGCIIQHGGWPAAFAGMSSSCG